MDELDIFEDTLGANEFFDSTVSDSVMAAENQDGSGDGGQQAAEAGAAVVSSYTVGEDGHYYNDDGERVYYWVPPSELGDVITRNPTKALYQDTGGYYTEQEIRKAWGADEGMGYLKEQTDWDNYWGYLTERQSLIEQGIIYDATGSDAAGRQKRQEFLESAGGLRAAGGAKEGVGAMQQLRWEGYSSYYEGFLQQEAQLALMSKYGISPVIQNKDGDVFGWNGSSYTKVIKVDDHNYGAIVGGLIKSFVISAITGGLVNEFVSLMSNVGGLVGEVANGINDFLSMNVGAGASSVEVADAINSSGIIMNLVGGAVDAANVGDGNFQGDGDNTGSTMYGGIPYIVEWLRDADDLPPDHIWVGNKVIHEPTGSVVYVWTGSGDPTGLIYFEPYKEGGGGGGGAPAADTTDADSDGVPASQDPDDNNPNVPNAGGTVVNDTGEEVTTGGNQVDGNGAVVGAEHNWKYLGDGCFVKIDENGAEIPGTKVCDPDYTTGDYGAYQVGGVYSAGDDPFGTAGGDEGETVDPNNPEASYPDAGTDLGYECLPNGDKVVYTADGEGGATTEIVKGGCLDNQDGGLIGSTVSGDDDDDDDDDDDGDDSSDASSDSTGQTETTSTSSIDELCSGGRPEEYGFGQIYYDEYCGDADGGGDGSGDGTGTGDGDGDGDGDGEGEGDGTTSPLVSGFAMGNFEGDVRGLSYQAQAVPGLLSGTTVNAMTDLNDFIARQLQKRDRMLT